MESERDSTNVTSEQENPSLQDGESWDKETRKRHIHIARELCEYGAWFRGELRAKERGSL